MNKLLFILVFMIMSLSCKSSYLKTTQQEAVNRIEVEKPKVTYNSDETTVKLKGIVTNAKNDCWNDGKCSIEVDDKWWIAITYGKRDPSFIPKESGLVTGIRFTKDNESIGKKVAVYAKIRKQNELSLEGNKAFYVNVIEE